MYYFLLAVAIIAEIIATSLLKASQGFTKLRPGAGCVLFYVICYYTFSKAINGIDLGIAYATWCGVGIVATAIIAWIIFGQKLSPAGIAGLILIVAGCVILNLFGTPGQG